MNRVAFYYHSRWMGARRAQAALRVLGSLGFESCTGDTVRLSRGQRQLLAALAIGNGGVVRSDVLGDIAELSGPALRTSLSRLRHRLGDGVIVTEGAGYRLCCDVDAAHFVRLISSETAFPARLSELDLALALWSGSAYEEFAHQAWAEVAAIQLNELRLAATEERAGLQISQRVRVGEAVATLTAHVAENPLRDSARGLLLEALAADGRQADALRAYQDYRLYLREETGTEPSPAVRSIERRIAVEWHDHNDVEAPAATTRRAGRATAFAPACCLPQPGGELVGRTIQCQDLEAMLRPSTVVTLVGPGGVGKTRLAVAVCHQAMLRYRDGVAWFDCSAIDDPGALPAAVASNLSISVAAHASVTDAVVEGLRGRESLLLFDNCEHLLLEAGSLLTRVVEGCAGVAIIATSRAPLGIRAEQVFPVDPLDPAGAGAELFIQRALAADVAFSGEDDRASITALCTRLDGLPLAIELAAARVRTMAPAEVLGRLDANDGIVGRTSGRARQRTLTDTLDWSYQLLDTDERRLLGRLAIFGSGFDQRAVEAVCGQNQTSGRSILVALAGLVDQSMVATERTGHHTRYRLLETIRGYARRKISNDDAQTLATQHLAHYRGLVTEAFAQWRGDEYQSAAALFDREWDNIRLAVKRALSTGDAASIDCLLEGVAWPGLWSVRQDLHDWAGEASQLAGCGPATIGLAAHTSALRGQTELAAQLADVALAAAHHPHHPETHHAWAARFLVHTARGESALALSAAHAAHTAMVAGYGEFADAFWSSIVAFLEAKDNPSEAARLAGRAERLIGATRNPALSAEVLSMLARYHGRIGQPTRGLTYCHEALALADEHHLAYCRNSARAALAFLTSNQRIPAAPLEIADALAGAYDDRLWFWVWQSVGTAARWLANAGELEAAAVLIGHLDAHDHGNVSAGLRELIDALPDGWAPASRGARLHRDSIVAFALERLRAAVPATA